ncbi:MAG TPA: ankyrin repeat domain-containing protein [Vicinamibacterales bacterium]|nr:ankyrin repeat domain-containing protein [Vicinamibacterales bacterium]
MTRRTISWLAIAITASTVVGYAAAGGDPSIITAAKNDDVAAVRAQLAKRANVNEVARDGSTALLWAVYNGNVEMTRTLLAAGAPVNSPNHYGITPLLQAARSGDATLINMLVKGGADVFATHPDGETPLMAVARTGHLDALKILLEAGAPANVADLYQQETPLMWAAAEGHVAVVNELLKAGAEPNRQAHVNGIDERKHGDYPSGGFTALHFAVRNGYGDVAEALIKGGADPKITNADGLTPTMVAITNDRFDLAKKLVELGAPANDGSLYFAVDMHDATTDMRAHDGSRLRADHQNQLTSLDLIRFLLDKGADPNKAFQGQLHNTSLCCDPEINSSPFYRAAVASDVEVLKVLLAKGAKVDWSPSEVKKPGDAAGAAGRGRGANANVGKTAAYMTMSGGRGAAFAAGPGFDRIGAPPFREPGDRDPVRALEVLLKAGANANAKMPDGSTLLHQAVSVRRTDAIRALVAAGAKLDAVNKDNQTPLMLAEKPDPPLTAAQMQQDPGVYRPRRDKREDVIATLRELMHLGKDDPTPQPPPLPDKKDEKKPEKKVEAEAGA